MLPTEPTRRRRGGTGSVLPELRTEMDRLLSDFFRGGNGSTLGGFAPATDLRETEDEYVVEMELAGFRRDDVEVSLEGETLTISGRREVEAEDETYRRRERAAGRFERSFRLPRSVKPEDVEARMENGLLRVRVPKSEEARSRKIEVEVG